MTDSATNKNPAIRAMQYEHEYLRKEIETNKKMVFERALLIAGAAFAATLLPKEAKGTELLGIPIIGALAFNLWITVNRLNSNARIIAYIQLFHEKRPEFSWVGWENALRLYRIWLNSCTSEEAEAKKYFQHITQYDNLTFYRPIFVIHIAMTVAISVLMSFRVLQTGPVLTQVGTLSPTSLISLNASVMIIFVIWVLWGYRPRKLQYGIEQNLILWRGVFESYERGCLKVIMENEPKMSTSLD